MIRRQHTITIEEDTGLIMRMIPMHQEIFLGREVERKIVITMIIGQIREMIGLYDLGRNSFSIKVL